MHNYNHLYYFYITAKSGSTTLAAHHLKVSQPSLSSQLKVLEDALGVNLFRRVGRSNKLTEEGVMAFGFCRRMFEVSEELTEVLMERLPSASRRINIGVTDELERSLVVEMISSFLNQFSVSERPKVSLISGGHQEIVDRMRFHEIDAVVAQKEIKEEGLVTLRSARAPVALIASRQLKFPKLVKSRPPTEHQLHDLIKKEGFQWIMPAPRFSLRQQTDDFLTRLAIKPRIVFESEVAAAMVRSVVDGIGIALVPLLYLSEELKRGAVQLWAPKEGFWKCDLWLGCSSTNAEDGIIKMLAKSFESVCDGTDTIKHLTR